MARVFPILLLTCGVLSLALAIAGYVAGSYGVSWFKSVLGQEMGLWKLKDILNVEKQRNDILKFDNHLEFDIILVLLIVATISALLALLSTLSMCCCQKNPSSWCCGAVCLIVLTFISASGGFGALIYAEVKFGVTWKDTDHGWSAICAWVGAAASFIALIISCITPCARKKDPRMSSDRGMSYLRPDHGMSYPRPDHGMSYPDRGMSYPRSDGGNHYRDNHYITEMKDGPVYPRGQAVNAGYNGWK